jgi:hypothetical protein
MDKMRQLMRIFQALLPQFNIPGHDNNKLNLIQINEYLATILGDSGWTAPFPTWGLPDGWSTYMATLLTWATGKEDIKDEDMKTLLYRPDGQSWRIYSECQLQQCLTLDGDRKWLLVYFRNEGGGILHSAN